MPSIFPRTSAGEDSERDMSTIGELSSPENTHVSEEQQSLDAEDDQLEHDVTAVPDDNSPEPQSQGQPDASLEARLSEDRPKRYNLREKTPSPLEQQTPSPSEVKVSNSGQRPPRRSRGPRRGQGFHPRLSRCLAAESPEEMTAGKEVRTLLLDPLEGQAAGCFMSEGHVSTPAEEESHGSRSVVGHLVL